MEFFDQPATSFLRDQRKLAKMFGAFVIGIGVAMATQGSTPDTPPLQASLIDAEFPPSITTNVTADPLPTEVILGDWAQLSDTPSGDTPTTVHQNPVTQRIILSR